MSQRLVSGNSYDTPEDALAHFGVKGMKWGVRRALSSTGGSGGGRKAPADREIQNARDRIKIKEAKLDTAARGVGRKSSVKDKVKLEKLTTDFLKDPDRVTALHMTNGEKFMSAIFDAPADAAMKGLVTGISRDVIESRQASGHYDRRLKKRVAKLTK